MNTFTNPGTTTSINLAHLLDLKRKLDKLPKPYTHFVLTAIEAAQLRRETAAVPEPDGQKALPGFFHPLASIAIVEVVSKADVIPVVHELRQRGHNPAYIGMTLGWVNGKE